MTTGGSAAAQVDVAANGDLVKHGRVPPRPGADHARQATVDAGRLGTAYFIRPVVHVRDLDADGEPVWVDTYTGCHASTSRFFRWLPSLGTYTSTEHGWRDIGYQRRRLDGDTRPELVSADALRLHVHGVRGLRVPGQDLALRPWAPDRRHAGLSRGDRT